MALKQQIENDLKAALLSGDRFKAEVLRGLKAVITNEEIAKGARETGLDDETIEQLVARELKKRNESAEVYESAGRTELSDNEKKEAEVLAGYLPKQLTEQEVSKVVDRIISELGVSGTAVMGQVIGTVKKELGNSADGSMVAKIVKDKLS